MLAREAEEYIDKLISGEGCDVKGALRAAANAEVFLRIFREKIAVKAAVYFPQVIDSIARKAVEDGNVSAANFLKDIIGFNKSSKMNVNLNNINVAPDELEQLRRNLRDRKVIEREVIEVERDSNNS